MNLTRRLVAGGIVVSSIALGAFAQQDVPHLEKRRNVTQLVVDGKPFLILGGELCADLERWANSSVPPCFFASDAASFITRHLLVVDGGFLASGMNQCFLRGQCT